MIPMSEEMACLVTIQNAALNPETSEETLRDLLIGTLELAEKNMYLIESCKRQINNYEYATAKYEALIANYEGTVACYQALDEKRTAQHDTD